MDGPAHRFTHGELAERSGVAAEFVARIVDLGLVAPAADGTFGTGDVQRARLVEACDRAGRGAELIAEAIAADRLSLAFWRSGAGGIAPPTVEGPRRGGAHRIDLRAFWSGVPRLVNRPRGQSRQPLPTPGRR